MPSKGSPKQTGPDLKGIVARVFRHYCAQVGRDTLRYTLTRKRQKQAISRAQERLKIHAGDAAEVEAEMLAAVDNLAASLWHKENAQQDWALIFRNPEDFEAKLNLAPRGTTASGQQRRYNPEDYGAA
jgi:hypothetical protein